MNKKITVQRSDGLVRYCILPGEGGLQKQFNLWLFGEEFPSGGYEASFYGDSLEIVDRIAFETVERFKVLSCEDTSEAVSPLWTDPETGKTGWK